MTNTPKPLENYTLIINPEGDALLLIDALPNHPKKPTIELKNKKITLHRQPNESYELITPDNKLYKKLKTLKEIEIVETAEPELGEDADDEKHYTALIKI